MKKVFCIVILVLFGLIKSSDVSGQQILWTTSKQLFDAKYVPLDSVKVKVMEYYDNNEYYVDNTGYDINRFLKIFKEDSKIGVYKKKLKELKIKKIVFCFKSNPGNGSIITVIFLGEKNFDMLSFSEVFSSGSQHTYPEDSQKRAKFSNWLNSVLE
jgi:hypothetical protein